MIQERGEKQSRQRQVNRAEAGRGNQQNTEHARSDVRDGGSLNSVTSAGLDVANPADLASLLPRTAVS